MPLDLSFMFQPATRSATNTATRTLSSNVPSNVLRDTSRDSGSNVSDTTKWVLAGGVGIVLIFGGLYAWKQSQKKR